MRRLSSAPAPRESNRPAGLHSVAELSAGDEFELRYRALPNSARCECSISIAPLGGVIESRPSRDKALTTRQTAIHRARRATFPSNALVSASQAAEVQRR